MFPSMYMIEQEYPEYIVIKADHLSKCGTVLIACADRKNVRVHMTEVAKFAPTFAKLLSPKKPFNTAGFINSNAVIKAMQVSLYGKTNLTKRDIYETLVFAAEYDFDNLEDIVMKLINFDNFAKIFNRAIDNDHRKLASFLLSKWGEIRAKRSEAEAKKSRPSKAKKSPAKKSQATEVRKSQPSGIPKLQPSQAKKSEAPEVKKSQPSEAKRPQAPEAKKSPSPEDNMPQPSEAKTSQATEVEKSQPFEDKKPQAPEVNMPQPSEAERPQAPETKKSQKPSGVFCPKHRQTMFVLFGKYKLTRIGCANPEIATIQCENDSIKVHKECVAKFAPKFAELLSQNKTLEIGENIEAVKCALYFGLTGNCRMPDFLKIQVIQFAAKYDFNNFEKIFNHLVTLRNFAQLIKYAWDNDNTKMKSLLVEKYKNHMDYTQLEIYREIPEPTRTAFMNLYQKSEKETFIMLCFTAIFVLFVVSMSISLVSTPPTEPKMSCKHVALFNFCHNHLNIPLSKCSKLLETNCEDIRRLMQTMYE